MSTQRESKLTVEVGSKQIALILNKPKHERYPNACFVLGHGASGDATTGNLPAIAEDVAKAGTLVLRYTCAGQLPARTKVLQGILDSKEPALQHVNRWILSGHSMGGRTACAVARQRQDVAAVILFSFPLHPPMKTSKEKPNVDLRDKDLVALSIPVLIVRGTKDNFSLEDIFTPVMARMQSARLQVHTVENGDHSLNTKTQVGKTRFSEWMHAVLDFVGEVFSVDPQAPAEDSGSQKQQRLEESRAEEPSKAKKKPRSRESEPTVSKKQESSRPAKRAKAART